MLHKGWIVTGLVGLGLAACFLPWPTHPGGASQVVAISLPDLDGDKRGETLRVVTEGPNRVLARLDATAGHFTHDVLSAPAVWPMRLAGTQPRWTLVDAKGTTVFDVRVVSESDRPQPDLVLFGGDTAKRYRWVERGFMKMDAYLVVPGFSVGLVMLGDPPSTLGALGDRASTTGPWHPLVPPGATFRLTADADGRVAGVSYNTPELVATNGVSAGASVADLEKRFPGHREGDTWVAPDYGMRMRLDASGRVRDFAVAHPWRDPTDVSMPRR